MSDTCSACGATLGPSETIHVRLPLVVIDGKAFSWEEVGHMLMTFEGFTLEARVKDTIELVGDVPSV